MTQQCGIILNRNKKSESDPPYLVCTDRDHHFGDHTIEDQTKLLKRQQEIYEIQKLVNPDLPRQNFKAEEFGHWREEKQMVFCVYVLTSPEITLTQEERRKFLNECFGWRYNNLHRIREDLEFAQESFKLMLEGEKFCLP